MNEILAHLIEIADKLSVKLKQYALPFKILLADGGFGSGENYAYLEAVNIEGFISLPSSYHPLRDGFNYDPERDVYVCRNGKFLYNHGIRMEKGFANHYYHALIKECSVCPFKKECCGNKRRQSLPFSVYRNYHQRMQQRIEAKKSVSMKRQRMATIKPVFGSLLNYYGMKRANAKGKQAAHKFMLMAGYRLQSAETAPLFTSSKSQYSNSYSKASSYPLFCAPLRCATVFVSGLMFQGKQLWD